MNEWRSFPYFLRTKTKVKAKFKNIVQKYEGISSNNKVTTLTITCEIEYLSLT